MRRLWRDNGLTIVLAGIFLAALAGQTITGWQVYNDEQEQYRHATVGLGGYLATGHFVEAVFENWESEFLQMALYVLLTVFLFQRGSAESKDPDTDGPGGATPDRAAPPGAPWPVRRGGIALRVYENSLSLAMFALFAASFALHAVGGARAYSHERELSGEASVSTLHYLGESRFWFESFQNWQSEFLSIAAIVLLSIVLRQQGSPESKPVDAPHRATGSG